MLKYRINRNNILSDKDLINIRRCEIIDLNPYNTMTKYNTTIDIMCYCDKLNDNIVEGETKLISFNSITLTDIIDITDVYAIPFYNNFVVNAVNKAMNTFTFTMNKFVELSIEKIIKAESETEKDENGDNIVYVYFYLNDNHFLDRNSVIDLWFYYNDNFLSFSGCEIVTNKCIRYKYSEFISSFGDFTFTNIDGVDVAINKEMINIRLFRPTYFFTYLDNYNVYFNNPKCKISIGLSNTNQINLLKEQQIEDYINDAKQKCINGIVDMEKDVYYPVYKIKDNEFKDLITIKFNLHFREHDGENWLTPTESFWNGAKKSGKGWELCENYFRIEDAEKQSDLLSYLNFTNNDVRYQKNRLKKSFIRLSFYDSMNMGDQNLLAYSTIYMDSGEYFSKYVKHISTTPYVTINNCSVSSNLTGIRVDREYNGSYLSNESFEDYRLSSQIKVSDKYNSDASSEGFYLYLYKDLFKNIDDEELTVYMKVEFNHAGYGRTIPFMMPYWDRKKWKGYPEKTGIKTFQEIINDWNKEDDTDGEYSAIQYKKFSYIRFKIKYDKSAQKYIYYLDDDTYGNDILENIENDNVLLLNLYEAKMV